MSRLWALTKVLFKNNILVSNINSKNKKKDNKLVNFVLFAFLIIFVIASLGVPIILTLDSVLSVAPVENILISLIIPLAGITTIVFSVFSVVSVFYLSKDSEHLLPLPIAPKDIMLSKFFVSLINEYYILFMFIFPCLIGVGIGISANIMYYIYMFVVFLLLPIIPSAIVVLIILLVTRFTGVIKNKDMFMYVSMFLVLSFALGYNFIVQEFIAIDLENIGMTFGGLDEQLVPYFKLIFPFYNSACDALINFNNLNGLFSLVAFISFNFIALLIVYLIADKLYLKTLIATRGHNKKMESIETFVKVKKRSTFVSLLQKEWLVVKRTPVFMLNIVVIVFLMPIILLMSFIIGYSSENSLMALDASVVNSYLSNPLVYLIILTIGLFFTSFSLAASTSISREGNSAWVMKTIPLSAFKQINAKVFFAVVLDLIGVILVAIVPIVVLKIPFYYIIAVFLPIFIIVIILNYFNIYLDLRKPKVKWSDESVAVKQNMNSLLSILLTMAISVIFGLLAFVFYRYNIAINVLLLSGIISVVCGIILAFVIYLFKKNENKLLDNVD